MLCGLPLTKPTRVIMSSEPDYRAVSLKLERLTGYDSIDTIESHYQDYDKPGLFRCCFPDCATRTRSPHKMWLHVHFTRVKHGLSFGAAKPEDLPGDLASLPSGWANQAERNQT